MRARAERAPRQLAADQRQGRRSAQRARRPDILDEQPLSVVNRPYRWRRLPAARARSASGTAIARGGSSDQPPIAARVPGRAAASAGENRRRRSRRRKRSRGEAGQRRSAAARQAAAGDDRAAEKRSDPAHARQRPRRLPDFVPPSLATLHDAPPSGPDWLHEIKFDGYRIEARLDHGKVRLLTRKQQDWTHRFKPIADGGRRAAGRQPRCSTANWSSRTTSGISSFSLLQTDLKDGRSDRFVYYVFDLLHLDGRDLTRRAAGRRARRRSQRLAEGHAKPRRSAMPSISTKTARVIFKHACDMELEGIVSKRRDAPYRSGRSDNFIKTKCHDDQEFVVAGFSPSTAMPKAVGALTVAFHERRQAALCRAHRHRLYARDGARSVEAARAVADRQAAGGAAAGRAAQGCDLGEAADS